MKGRFPACSLDNQTIADWLLLLRRRMIKQLSHSLPELDAVKWRPLLQTESIHPVNVLRSLIFPFCVTIKEQLDIPRRLVDFQHPSIFCYQFSFAIPLMT